MLSRMNWLDDCYLGAISCDSCLTPLLLDIKKNIYRQLFIFILSDSASSFVGTTTEKSRTNKKLFSLLRSPTAAVVLSKKNPSLRKYLIQDVAPSHPAPPPRYKSYEAPSRLFFMINLRLSMSGSPPPSMIYWQVLPDVLCSTTRILILTQQAWIKEAVRSLYTAWCWGKCNPCGIEKHPYKLQMKKSSPLLCGEPYHIGYIMKNGKKIHGNTMKYK